MRGKRLVNQIKKNGFLILSLLVYTLLAFYFFRFYRYQINPDGICYISIAQKYLQGNFSFAVNGYWNPLISWLLVPFLLLKIKALIGVKILLLIVGAVTLFGIHTLAKKLRINSKIQALVLIFIVPLILSFAFHSITPDLLTVCVVVFYLRIVLDNNYIHQKKWALLAGFVGALAYFAKTYNFYFILVHFLLVNAVLYFLKYKTPLKRKKLLLSFISGFSIFLILSGSWIFLLNQKYNKLMVGTSGTYNYAVLGPHSKGHPTHYKGFLRPPNPKALCAWEDPSYLEVKGWSPFDSTNNFNHQLTLIQKNIQSLPFLFSLNLLTLIMGLGITLSSIKRGILKYHREFLLLGAIFLYPLGYLLIRIEFRFLWLLPVLMAILWGSFLSFLWQKKPPVKFFTPLLLGALISCLLIYPYKFFQNEDYRFRHKDIYILSQKLKKYNIEGRVATDQRGWPTVLYLSYHLKTKYFGEASSEALSNEKLLIQELKKFNIDYFFVSKQNHFEILEKYKQIAQENEFPFKIYKINNRSKSQ